MAQAVADLAGIADPTPISDGISAAISLAKGDYLGAGLSLVSMVPYLGDAVGKSIKAARNAKQVGKLVERIREVSTRLQHLSGGARRTALPEVAAKVGEALGTEGRQVKRGYTPKPGERATTREEWYKENSRNRAEQTVSQADQMLEPINPQKATHGHGHADHGYQTTEVQQGHRIRTKITPSGRMGKRLSQVSHFHSPEAEAEALSRASRKLEAELRSGQIANFDITGEPKRHEVLVKTNREDGFGYAVIKQRDVLGNILRDSLGLPLTTTETNPLKQAKVIFEYIPSKDIWHPVTYYPER
ncbi:hypothetical protein [Anthocerotibacter panamensis]|uniref:hypothetical protein n=1 Tax=Anthocerotibacter panamensis TaxID=2857077 RepID=UPI001C406A64|nr:hypothetical protein [Anthocerotibacter panamensis]